ncbi:MAG: ATP-binding protein [Candidatus Melainabacteria bacterium]|nr:ATP-binding protein [Candidatus Melainabacteria bacterium]
MIREIAKELLKWSKDAKPLPTIVRGARQVGKSHTIREFGENHFDNFIEINLETDPKYLACFEASDIEQVLETIVLLTNQKIVLGKTLLFIDEIQESVKALSLLRSFYEKKPGLHIIAAGSLLEFVLKSQKISIPVGRVQYLFMQPMSFYEYLDASGNSNKKEFIQQLNHKSKINEAVHQELLKQLQTYFILGGMPQAVYSYLEHKDILIALQMHHSIINTYQDDFGKYSKLASANILKKLLYKVPKTISHKFKYVSVDSDFKAREIKAALELAIDANLIYKIKRTSGAGAPLEAEASEDHFKLLFLDIGLMQSLLGLDKEIATSFDIDSIASGALAEQFVGQELLMSLEFYRRKNLYYWEKSGAKDSAEIDYLQNISGLIYPIEVKAGKRGKLKSMHSFMQKYKPSLGLRLYGGKIDYEDALLSLPLYACRELHRIVSGIED